MSLLRNKLYSTKSYLIKKWNHYIALPSLTVRVEINEPVNR